MATKLVNCVTMENSMLRSIIFFFNSSFNICKKKRKKEKMIKNLRPKERSE